jgi:rhamnose utilization protein RhaD (predicted bifunctional aldolase and dehydrogenase)/NAD(P)-dependent dehydrogenase (short-subunit alcohol dehydrogenase family)
MESRWNAPAAAALGAELGEALGGLVYASRLLGQDPSLVLHGGGNTSVKTSIVDITGDEVPVLYVKGSGGDLATIGPEGFSPLRLERTRRLGELAAMTDTEMVNELRCALLDASAPNPSVEAILHASLPFPAVLHTHADALLALTDTADDESHLRACYSDRVVLIPYVMPGFPLARECARRFPAEATERTEGMVLRQHGLFTFGPTMEVAYERMIRLVSEAEAYVAARATGGTRPAARTLGPVDPLVLAELRAAISAAASAPMIVTRHADAAVAGFVARADLAERACGPITPDHVIRTKRLPLVGRDVGAYVDAYHGEFAAQAGRSAASLTELDPAPRVVLDAELGMLCAGRRPADAAIVADLYHHTMAVVDAAESLGGFVPLPADELFDVEYWELEQAKLARAGAPPPLAGQVALVTGAASGIGASCAAALAAQGAAIVGLDVAPAVSRWDGPAGVGVVADARDAGAVARAIGFGIERFGGIDMVIASAGVFGPTMAIAELDDDTWRQVQSINTDAVLSLLRLTHPFLQCSPAGGRVVLIGSKNVPAPGAGAAAYSASKAALTQLGRVAALEWAADGIRVNTVHPDGVFDTALWTDDVLAARAARYGMTVAEYRRRNLLGLEITSADVGSVVLALCSPAFRAVTGAQVPIDGGNDRVI